MSEQFAMTRTLQEARRYSVALRAALRTPEQGWAEHAACRDLPGLFHGGSRADVERCRALCAGCTVLGSCLAEAFRQEGQDDSRVYGVRGGMIPAERRRAWRAPEIVG